MPKLISIIAPVYNEEANIDTFYERVSEALAPLGDTYDVEFVFTDNHSEDNTFALLEKLAHKDPRVRVFRFSKNFGFQRSILTGYRLARGDAAIQIDCDLQDPPEIIRDFVHYWEQGYKVVYGVRKQRQEGLLITAARRVFYAFIDRLSEDELPRNAGDFRLVDKTVLKLVSEIDDQEPYLRGYIAGLGFQQIGVEYDRDARTAGESKFGFRDLINLAIDGITQHSLIPLRAFTYLGMLTSLGAVAYALYATALHFFGVGDDLPRGWASLAVGIFFIGGVQLMGIGILGEYVGRTYKQVKQRPTTIIEKYIDAHSDQSPPSDRTKNE